MIVNSDKFQAMILRKKENKYTLNTNDLHHTSEDFVILLTLECIISQNGQDTLKILQHLLQDF